MANPRTSMPSVYRKLWSLCIVLHRRAGAYWQLEVTWFEQLRNPNVGQDFLDRGRRTSRQCEKQKYGLKGIRQVM